MGWRCCGCLRPFTLLKKILLFSAIFISVGLIFIIIGVAGPPVVTHALHKEVNKRVENTGPHSKNYELFQKSRVPMYMQFWMFNVTNPHEVMYHGEKPNVVEIGPYSFRERWEKFDITYPSNKKFNRFKTYKYYTFDKDTSKKGVDAYNDYFWTPNVPLFGALSTLSGPPNATNWYGSLAFSALVSASLIKEEPLVFKNARDIAFGYEDPIISLLHSLNPDSLPAYPGLVINATSKENAIETTTYDQMWSGKTDIKKINHYYLYQDRNNYTFYKTPEANSVDGSDGYQFGTNLDKHDHIQVYIPQIARTLRLNYAGTSKVRGVKLFDFHVDPKEFLSASEYPKNDAFYQYGPSGVWNITSLSQDAPVFVSKAHWLDADPFYLDNTATGISPAERKIHDIVISIEPHTGLTFQVFKRQQINVIMDSIFFLYPNMTKMTYAPIAWFVETATITEHYANQYKHQLYPIVETIHYDRLISPIVGGILCGVGVFAFVVYAALRRFYSYDSLQINDEERLTLKPT